jgi:hypothetical protein
VSDLDKTGRKGLAVRGATGTLTCTLGQDSGPVSTTQPNFLEAAVVILPTVWRRGGGGTTMFCPFISCKAPRDSMCEHSRVHMCANGAHPELVCGLLTDVRALSSIRLP